jgi:hypothetical protein
MMVLTAIDMAASCPRGNTPSEDGVIRMCKSEEDTPFESKMSLPLCVGDTPP